MWRDGGRLSLGIFRKCNTKFATIPPKQKKVVQALSEAHSIHESGNHFDDVVRGKEKGLVILLQ